MADKTYTTIQGDTWDAIAFRVFGDEYLMHHLIDANPQYREIVVFPAGVRLVVPEVPEEETVELPPWKVDEGE